MPPASAGQVVEVVFHVRSSQDGHGAGGALAVRLAPADARDSAAGQLVPLPPAGAGRAALPAGTTWRAELVGDEVWGPPATFFVATEPQTITLLALPAAPLGARLRLQEPGTLPARVDLRFQPALGSQGAFPETSVSCPVAEGAFRCMLPAAKLDLKVQAAGFASHFFWNLAPQAGRELDLGELGLRPAAAMLGWLDLPQVAGFEFRDTRVTARPIAGAATVDPGDLARRPLRSATAVPDERGFFALVGLEAGVYEVEAAHPGAGRARRAPVLVRERSETEVRDLRFEVPVELDVAVEPPGDPFGTPWNLVLVPIGTGLGEDEVLLEVDQATRRWRAKVAKPGQYLLEVSDSRQSRWFTQELEVVPGIGLVEVEAPFSRLEGKLLSGDEPLQATLWFGGRQAAPSIGVPSDEAGNFYVFLPRRTPDQPWRVEIRSRKPRIHAWIEQVHVPARRPGELWPKTVLRLPVTRLSGVVIDDRDQAVRGAQVLAVAGGARPVSVQADEAGAFELLALAEARWRVEATGKVRGETLVSTVAEVEVAEDGPGIPLRLVLGPRRRLTGQVISPAGDPVAGATVLASSAELSKRVFENLPSKVSDPAGVFALDLPLPRGSLLTLTVLAPGFAAMQTELMLLDDPQSVVLPVETAAGTLEVAYRGESSFSGLEKRRWTWLYQSSRFATPAHLEAWAEAQGVGQDGGGGSFLIPGLAPGPYLVCFEAGGSTPGAGLAPSRRCEPVEITPYATSLVVVDVEAGT